MTADSHQNENRLPPFLQRINEKPLVFDGGMGTMIYERGVFVNTCYDELCLNRPELILDIHQSYVAAGAEVIETNSFGANRITLGLHGLGDRVEAINAAAVGLARKAAGDAVYVAGSVGPCSDQDNPFVAGESADCFAAAFTEQCAALVDAGVDLLMLETFDDIDELLLAASVARKTKRPVLASFALQRPAAKKILDESACPEVISAKRLDKDPNVDMIGLNCRVGPAELFHPAKRILKHIAKPLALLPNAGRPREVGGRMLYMNSPEYFTEFCKRFIELGAKAVGGCCGTTPDHVREAVRAIHSLDGVTEHVTIAVSDAPANAAEHPRVPTAEKSPLGAKLASRDPVRLVEMLPPTTGGGLDKFLAKCRQCQEAGIDAINLPDGPRASARMSVTHTALAVQENLGIEPIPHYCCRDRNLIGMQSDLLGGYALGLRTWLPITGDPPKLGQYPDATGVFDLDAVGVTQLVDNLNKGVDAAGQPISQATRILIGVGANPVAVDLDREIEHYFKKIDAGAEFAITQPIFDADSLLRFLEITQRYRKTLPLIVGLYPLISFKNAQFMRQHVPGVEVPDAVLERMQACSTKQEAMAEGVKIVREIKKEVADAVVGFQISAPLGRVDVAIEALH